MEAGRGFGDESGEQRGGGRAAQPPGTGGGYVIKVPKDQVLRVPPPENTHRFNLYKRKAERKKRSRRVCFCLSCRCIACTFVAVFVVLLVGTIAAGTLYVVYRPKLPSFQVESLTLSSPRNEGNSTLLVLAENTNSKLGLDYEGGGAVAALFYGMEVGRAEWPSFGLAAGEARGVSAVLTGGVASDLARIRGEGKRVGSVVGRVEIGIPASVEVDSFKIPVTVKGSCDVKVATAGKVLHSDCHVHLELLS